MLYITNDPDELRRFRVICRFDIALGLCRLADDFQLAEDVEGARRLWIRASLKQTFRQGRVKGR